MKHSLFSLIVILLVSIFPCHAQTTNMQAPKLVRAQAAFAPAPPGLGDNGPVVFFSQDGQYVLAYSNREAKAWRMPAGELIYRFNTSMMKDDNQRGVLNYEVTGIDITGDGKYIYARGGTGVDFMMMPAYLETGELLEDGQIKDSIRSGAYQFRSGLRSVNELSLKMTTRLYYSSPFKIKRETDCNDGEGVSIQAIVPSSDYPGELIVCFSQSFCGSREFINERLTESVKTIRDKQKKSSFRFFDVHVARYNPATNKCVYLGNFIKGAGNVDYDNELLWVFPSPVDDVVYVSGLTHDKPTYMTGRGGLTNFQSFNSLDGTVLWKPTDKLKGEYKFKGFNEFGFAVFTILNEGKIASEITFEPVTGKVINNRIFSSVLPWSSVYSAQWNVSVVISQTANKDWGIGLYNGTTGEHLMALSDAAGAADIAGKTKAENDRINAYIAASRKAMQDSWDRQIAENALAAAVAQEKKSVDAAYRAAHYKPCPLCSGSGVWVNSGVAKAYRKTDYNEGRAMDGSRVIHKTTESSTGGYWEQRSACLKCHGRGEVAR